MAATATAPTATGEKQKWLKVLRPHDGHEVGDIIRVAKTHARTLVEKGEAQALKNPVAKEFRKSSEQLLQSLRDDVKGEVKGCFDTWIKSVDESKKTWPGPLQGLGATVYGDGQGQIMPGPGGWDVGRLGKDFKIIGHHEEDGSPIFEPVGLERFGSGIGMGPFLCDLYEYKERPCKELAERICKDWKVRLSEPETRTKAPLAEASGITGGYTVPIEFAMRLMQLVVQQSVVRPRATIIPMGARSIRIPYLDVTTPQSAGVTAFLGGLQMYWTEEAQTRTETEPSFKQLELVAHELSGYTLASNTILADNAVALDALLTRLFSQGISWFSDYAFLQGVGAGRPVGILNAPATISVSRTSPNKFLLADAATMLSKLLTTSMGSSVFIMSQTCIPQLVQMADAAGRVVWIPNQMSPGGGAAQTMPSTLFGLPIIFTEKLPALGSTGDVMLADLSYYLIGDRMSIEIASSIHFKFTNNQTTWRVLARMDGQPWLDNAVTLADAVTTVSPFVILK
jgi:HK97 family phage major capsid protein